jgi:putative lipoic acid-binding regulatory protein
VVILDGNEKQPKLELDYPCQWRYKIVGEEKDKMITAVCEIISEKEHTIENSNKSKSGKYTSLNLDLLVHNEDERNFIYEALKAHQHIKMVL